MCVVLNAILDLQYAAQHFGFHPKNFLDLVYNVFFENVYESLTQMKQYMVQEFKEVLPPFVVATHVDNFLHLLGKACDKFIDKLEIFLCKNTFDIEPHIILPEDEIHIKNPHTKNEEEILDAEIEELKQKILVEKAKKFSLKRQINQQKEVKEKLLHLQSELRQLLTIANQDGVTPENAQSLISDLTKLLSMKPEIH